VSKIDYFLNQKHKIFSLSTQLLISQAYPICVLSKNVKLSPAWLLTQNGRKFSRKTWL